MGVKLTLTPPLPVRIVRYGLIFRDNLFGTEYQVDCNWRPTAGSTTGQVVGWGGTLHISGNLLPGVGGFHAVGRGPTGTREGQFTSSVPNYLLREAGVVIPGEEVVLNVSDPGASGVNTLYFVEYENLPGRGEWVTGDNGNMTEYAA